MLSLLNHLNELQPLSPEATTALLKLIHAKELRKGQVWLQEGAVCDKMSFVVKGLLKLYFESGCKEVILQFAREGEWLLAANSYFDRVPSQYIIRCVEPTVVIYINRDDFTNLLARFTELNYHFKCIAEERVRQLESHSCLLMLALRERYEKVMTDNSWMVNHGRLTDRSLAAYLGMTANSLCGFKKKSIK